jgi:MFS transporter, putative metabolite:H+ symporter
MLNGLGDRAHPRYFWLGAAAVTAGVGFHLPMFVEARRMNFHLAGMPVDWRMLLGMALIAGGTLASGYGLLPGAREHRGSTPRAAARAAGRSNDGSWSREPGTRAAGAGSGRLRWAHWQLMLVLALALVIDAMKPASLGFTIPGMSREYGLPREVVALFPLLALTGLTIGSYTWGVIGDAVGRRAAILLSGVMFVGTAICGAMPGFIGNLIMCFAMGLAAGGMLPITYALLAECMPSRQRGWAMVLLGGLGLVGGFFVTSGAAALLEPLYGWRMLWFLNAPTGLILILCYPLIPESPRFLLLRGRTAELAALAARFDIPIEARQWAQAAPQPVADSTGALLRFPFRLTTVTLNCVGLAWGLVNFGLLLWLPAELRLRGLDVAGSNVLLFRSALVALPTMFAVALLYGRWSTKWTLFALTVVTTAGLFGLSLIDAGLALVNDHLLLLLAGLMVGVNGIIAVLLPYAAENYPVLVRGRGTGLVAGSSKLGGLAAQALSIASLVPGLGVASMALAASMAGAAGMVACCGKETHRGALDDFDQSGRDPREARQWSAADSIDVTPH